jgi:hypothetical protein
MKSKFTKEDWEYCLQQWNLKCIENGWEYTGDDAADLRKLLAGLEKWVNTFLKNDVIKKQKTQTNARGTNKPGGQQLDYNYSAYADKDSGAVDGDRVGEAK